MESNPLLEEGEEKPEPEVDIKEDGDEVDYDENSQEKIITSLRRMSFL